MRRKDREVTNKEQQLEILDNSKVCRIGMIDGEEVYIVPVNYGYEMQDEKLTLYFHGATEGRKMELLKTGKKVGVELDSSHELVEGNVACQYSYLYASMIATGIPIIIEDVEEKKHALQVLMKHQTGKMFDEFQEVVLTRTAVIKLEIKDYTFKSHRK